MFSNGDLKLTSPSHRFRKEGHYLTWVTLRVSETEEMLKYNTWKSSDQAVLFGIGLKNLDKLVSHIRWKQVRARSQIHARAQWKKLTHIRQVGRKKCSMENAFRRNKKWDFFRSLYSFWASMLDALSVLMCCKIWWSMNAGFPTSASPALTL